MIQREALREGWGVIISSLVGLIVVALIIAIGLAPPTPSDDAQDTETLALWGTGAGRDMSAVCNHTETETTQNDTLKIASQTRGRGRRSQRRRARSRASLCLSPRQRQRSRPKHSPAPPSETEPETVGTEYVEPDVQLYTDADAVYIAKTIGVEAPYCSTMEQAAVAWCILNRVDDPRFPDTVAEVVIAPHQFAYFDATPLREDLYLLALDVLGRWQLEKQGEAVVGRVLPREYVYFWGDLVAHNYFTITEGGAAWDWSWGSPYGE